MNNEDTTSDATRVAALRAEAARLEAAAKTLGQVLAEASGIIWTELSQFGRDQYDHPAAVVAAHVIGAEGVLVNRADLARAVQTLTENMNDCPEYARLRKALV